VTTSVIATSAHIWYHHRRRAALRRPATLIVGLVAVQVTLGALTVLSQRDVWINSAHVVCGALVLTTSLVITLRAWRVRFATATAAVDRGIRVRPAALEPDVTSPGSIGA
jgi:heme A synthase